MTPDRLRALLERIDEVRRLSPRDQLRVQRILQSDLAQDREELRAALASALSRSEDEWQRIAARFDECVGRLGHVDAEKQVAAVGAPGRRRWWRGAVGIAVLLVGIGGVLGLVRPCGTGPDRPDMSVEFDQGEAPDLGAAPDMRQDLGVIVTLREPERQAPEETWQAPPWTEAAWRWLLAGGVAALLCVLGARFVLLPSGLARRREEEAKAERARLSKAELQSEDPLRPVYRVDAGLPFPPSVVEDSAVHLGRLFVPRQGLGLDVPATVNRTIEAGGQLVLVPERRRAARDLVILVDQERGDHPWLWGIWRLLEAWSRRGVGMVRYRFRHMPIHLWPVGPVGPMGDGAPVLLTELARRHEGACLVIFSRRLTVRGEDGEAPWVADLAAWPVRAWVDPDPRPEAERGRGERQDLKRLRAAGVARFPYSAEGLVALARHLSLDGEGPPAPWPELPGDGEVRAQVHLLATVAAMVPDPTWEQIDGLRQLLAEHFERLNGPWYVHLLLQDFRGELEEAEGFGLSLTPEAEDRLIKALRKREGRGGVGALEKKVRERLLKEIADDKDGVAGEAGALWRLKRDLARARHQAVLEPARATELLAPFFGGGVDFEARRDLANEAGRQGGEAGWRGVRALIEGGGGVKGAELVLGGWRWSLLLSPAVALLVLWGVGWRLGGVAKLAGLGQEPPRAEVIWPRTKEVTRPERPDVPVAVRPPPLPPQVIDDGWKKETAWRAKMVEVKPGRFQMGSPEEEKGRFSNEKQHWVRISRAFLLGVTEVTQGQYRKVMGMNPSEFKKGDTYPVEQVSWLDAVKYCNKLSAQEKREPCYVIKPNGDVDWPKRLDCPGYRLPTEAEWEYAARANKKTIYAGSNNLDEVGWYDRNSGDSTHPVAKKKANGGLYDMSGNVWEWVWDWYDDYAGQSKDPTGPRTGQSRVFRGGSWSFVAELARVAIRFSGHPGLRSSVVGFRVARSLP